MFDKNDKTDKIIYNKQDVMNIFQCKSDKALRIMKMMHQMKLGNKIGREYYVEKEDLIEFLEFMKGKHAEI